MLKLFKYTKGYRLTSILSSIFVILEVAMEVYIPSVLAKILNVIGPLDASGMKAGSAELAFIKNQSILMVGCAILSLIFGLVSAWCAANAATGFAKNLRVGLFKKVQTFSFKNIDHFSQGGLVTRLTGDVFYIQNSYQMIIRVAIRLPIMLIFALVMSIRINAGVTTVYSIALPVLALILAGLSAIAMPTFRKAFLKIDALNNATSENIHSIRVVKSFVKEEKEKRKFDKIVTALFRLLLKAERTLALTQPILRVVIYSCIVAISYIGSKFVLAGKMSTGDLVAQFTYNFQILFSMMLFAGIMTIIIMSGVCFKRINEIFAEKVDITSPENPVTTIKNGDIEFNDVTFSYTKDAKLPALSNINLKINSGEMIGIVGPTGCGKSSLINLIARLFDVNSGAVLVGDEDVKRYDLNKLRDGVAVVLQKNNLFSGTIRSTLQWGCEDATDEQIYNALRVSQIEDFVRTLPDKLDTHVEQGGKNFSGGQKQRLCIARALLKQPKILILDDSSSALDSATDKRLRATLKAERPELTKIIIAQKILSVAECDRIVVMKSGQIEAIGTHDELLASNSFYSNLYHSQLNADAEGENAAN